MAPTNRDSADPTGSFPDPDWSEPQALASQRLGDFLLLREIGSGGMGVVYEAIQESVGRHVALKVLPKQSLANPKALDRFRREVRAAGRLHHTHIVPVFGTGEVGDVHFYAMQFIQGQGLDRILEGLRQQQAPSSSDDLSPTRIDTQADRTMKESATEIMESTTGRLPEHRRARWGQALLGGSRKEHHRTVARIGLHVAEALGYAHRIGVVHRDIKPSNLLLDETGTVWVTDFGLAKSDDAEDLTMPGDVFGTLRYMAPERFEGRSLPQGDLYSLGLTLYELLTLRPAFEDTNRPRLLEKVLHDTILAPRHINPTVPLDLETIVLKAAARDPADRYPSADSMAEDLRRFLSDQPILARPLPWHERTWRWCRRNPVVASLVVVVALLLLTVSVVAGTAAIWLDRERDSVLEREADLERVNQVLSGSRQREREAKEDALAKLRFAHLNQARAQRWSGRAGRRFESLKALQEAAHLGPSLELRNEAIACLTLADLRKGPTVEGCPGNPNDMPLIHFDGPLERFVRSDARGNLSIRRAADGEELFSLPGPGEPAWVGLFSPDGRSLAVKHHARNETANSLVLWDLERRRPILRLPKGVHSAAFTFSPDGALLAIAQPTGTIQLLDARSGELLSNHRTGIRAHRIAWHPSAPRLALSSFGNPQVAILDLDARKVIQAIELPASVRGIDWHPGGKLLAAAGSDFRVYLLEAETGIRHATLEGHQGDVIDLAFSHTGSLLASHGWDHNLILWDVRTGKPLVTHSECITRGPLALRFSSDDRRLGYFLSGTRVGLLEVATGGELRMLHGHVGPKGPCCVDFSPDHSLIATAGEEGVRIWDAASGCELRLLPTGPVVSSFFQADGKALLVCTRNGLESWTIEKKEDAKAAVVCIGPRVPLPSIEPVYRMAVSRDGAKAVLVSRSGMGAIQDTRPPGRWIPISSHPDMEWVSMSPDSRRVATGTWKGLGIKIWDATTGKLHHQLAGEFISTRVEFSPDGTWLATSEPAEYRFWEMESWKPGPRMPRAEGAGIAGPMAFSQDGKLFAGSYSQHQIHLYDAKEGRLLAALETPLGVPVNWMSFSWNDRYLAACGNQVVQVWDLTRIREQLLALNLAEGLPAAASETSTPRVPLRINLIAR